MHNSLFRSFIAVLFLTFLVGSVAKSQEPVTVRKSNNKVIIDDKIYFLHVVKPGQTLYSISRAYEVNEKDIAIENPGVYAGLRIGQVLKIPEIVPRIHPSQAEIDTTKFIIYHLKEGETLFALSRKFNIPVNEIKDANPDLDYTDMQIGQQILIPKPKLIIEVEKQYRTYRVKRKDTFYSLTRKFDVTKEDLEALNPELRWGGLKAGQIIRIPEPGYVSEIVPAVEDTGIIEIPDTMAIQDSLKSFSLEDYAFNLPLYPRKVIKVAYLIPFNYYEEPDTIPAEDEEENALNENIANHPKSVNFLEFMDGAMMAIDSLEKMGVPLNIKFFDTRRSSSHTKEILKSEFMNDVDLIIGPFYSWNVEVVSEFSSKNHVPMVTPFYSNRELTEANPFLFQLNPSYQTEFDLAANYLADEYENNYVLIYKSDSTNLHKIDYLKEKLYYELEEHTHFENIILKEISYVNISQADLMTDLDQTLSKDKKNIVIVPETDEAFVSTIVTQLFFQLREFDIEVFGMSHWGQFSNIEYSYYHQLKLKYLSPYYFSYDDPEVNSFLNKFTYYFRSEPTKFTRKGCSYAFVGFDATYTFLSYMWRYDNSFIRKLNKETLSGLAPGIAFQKTKPWGGFENKYLGLVSYSDNFNVEYERLEYKKHQEPDKPVYQRIFRFSTYDEVNE